MMFTFPVITGFA